MFREKILFENIIVDDVLEKTFTKRDCKFLLWVMTLWNQLMESFMKINSYHFILVIILCKTVLRLG